MRLTQLRPARDISPAPCPTHLVVRVLSAHCGLQGVQKGIHQPLTFPEPPSGLCAIRTHVPGWPRASLVTSGSHGDFPAPPPHQALRSGLHL